jgi:NADPH:quinone reductase-like Zn-dependent oxidoreductase
MVMGWKADRFGGPEVLCWTDIGALEPGPGQLRVRVRASGVNFAETRMLAGTYSGIDLPLVMGMESSGVVEAIGDGVVGFAVGDRVFGRARGSHAEAVLMDASLAMPMPDNLSFAEAAAIPVGWHTAWHALHTVANLKPGERVLIEAAGSSVGSAALQIAKDRGCWVATTASRDDKCRKALEAGADAAYNYHMCRQFSAEVLRDTGGAGVDVACMTIGEETASELLDSMANHGRVVMYGSTGGRQVCFSLNIGTRNIALLSMSISTSPRYLAETIPSFAAEALPRFADGRFRSVVDTILPMAEIAKAHAMISDRRHFGKIILVNEGD